MSRSVRSMAATSQTLDREFSVVRSAIAMVASGGAPAVTVGGLQFGEELVGPARRFAFRAGVRVVPLWTCDERGADIRIERLGDD